MAGVKVRFASPNEATYIVTWRDDHTTVLHVDRLILVVTYSSDKDLQHLVGSSLSTALDWVLRQGCSYKSSDGGEARLL